MKKRSTSHKTPIKIPEFQLPKTPTDNSASPSMSPTMDSSSLSKQGYKNAFEERKRMRKEGGSYSGTTSASKNGAVGSFPTPKRVFTRTINKK